MEERDPSTPSKLRLISDDSFVVQRSHPRLVRNEKIGFIKHFFPSIFVLKLVTPFSTSSLMIFHFVFLISSHLISSHVMSSHLTSFM
jgi:hypothetical protein